jgi:hypothetical protein
MCFPMNTSDCIINKILGTPKIILENAITAIESACQNRKINSAPSNNVPRI